MASAASLNINFEREKEQIEAFLSNYSDALAFDFLSSENTTSSPPLKPQQLKHNTRTLRSNASASATSSGPKYLSVLQEIANRRQENFTIELDDVNRMNPTLCRHISANTKRYAMLFCQVADKLMPPATIPISDQDNVLDTIIQQRQLFERSENDAGAGGQDTVFPPVLKRRYTLFFAPLATTEPIAVRHVRATHIGQLVSLRAIVTRVSDVKPLLAVCTYSCDECGHEIFQEIVSRAISPLVECQSPVCLRNRSRGKLHMQVRASRFLRFQELRVQELPEQVPMGHIPRTMVVHLYEGLARSLSHGDVVVITGVFLPTPYVGFRAIRAGLLADTYLEAMHVRQMKRSYASMRAAVSEDRIRDLMNRATTANANDSASAAAAGGSLSMYDLLARSICPEIYGHEDVKRALLLLLVGGVTKQVADGMKIRGEINVLLMGDPGVAKSQLLKWVSKTAPRGVYTTGKGSSGVGLTAAVIKDPVSNEMVLEGGALVLADNGVCCIDEFDKMEDGDKTAIHEVMEQQTISISKAGIVTSLNARASVLAAANPVYGRYNTSLSPNQNINLPAALLSRFDIVFLLLDTPNLDDDTRLAQHVTTVHMTNAAPLQQSGSGSGNAAAAAATAAAAPATPRRRGGRNTPQSGTPAAAAAAASLQQQQQQNLLLTGEELRAYVAHARNVQPEITSEIERYLTNIYVGLRKEEAREGRDHGYTTARTLVSMLRMAQALARLRFADTVSIGDVDEAVRLMNVSRMSLLDRKLAASASGKRRYENHVTRIFNLVKAMSAGESADGSGSTADGEISIIELKERVIAKGMTETQLEDMLREYSELGVVFVSKDRSRLRLVQ